MRAIRIFGVGLLLGLPLVAQELTDGNFEKWRSLILPKEEELAWLKIPWRSALGEAVIEGRKKDLPLLFWAMNGHPLACT